jgi:hypothetical protein
MTVIARLDGATQYPRARMIGREAPEYWATRWSVSPGGALRRPGGGW